MRWSEFRNADPHLKVVAVIVILPVAVAVLAALAMLVRTLWRLLG